MRNLKRALSLALAAIMVMSLMVIGAGAVSIDDFSDSEKIVNKEAVTTMVSLGVINGKDDGSFDPQGIVTRAEMAKLISVMLNGGKDPTLGSITANFTDTKGHWAENYIAYVANLGIVDGRGDGTFGPNDQVTGAQAAKMLLTALGYRSEIEGFTGASWAINVQLKGNDIKLFDGLTINPDKGLSRDDTAQMIYNAVQAQEVEYRNLDGNYNNVVYPTNKGTMLANRFDVVKVEGVVVANDFFAVEDIATAPTGKTRIRTTDVYKDKNGDYQTSTDNYAVVVPNDMVGKRIVIYVKFQNNLAPNAVGSVVIGTPILSDKNNIVVTNDKLKDASKVKDALKGSGIAITKDKDHDYATEVLVTEKGTAIGGTTRGVQAIPGVEQTFIDHNDDGIVDYIIQRNPGLAKVTTYNAKDDKLTLTGIGSIDFDDIANPGDVAKDDYVLVAKYNDTYYLTKAENVSGEVTKYDSSNDKITIDGTAYGAGAGKNVTADLYDQADYATMMNEMVEGTYTLYLDPFGNILGYVENEGAVGNYAVVTASDDTSSTNQQFYAGKVKLQMSDGTSGTYDVNLLASAKKWDSNVNTGSNSNKERNMANLLGTNGLVGTIVTYSLDGNTVTMGLPSQANNRYSEAAGAANEMKSSKSYYDFGSVRVMADNNTVFFIQDKNGDFTTIVGLNKLPSTGLTIKGSESSVVYYTGVGSKTNVARAIYAHVTEEFTSNSNYAFVSDKYSKNTNGIYLYPVVFEDGTVGELKSKTNQGQFNGQVVEYQMAAEGYATMDTDKYTVNMKYVSEVGKYAVDLVDADNHGAGGISYALLNNHKVWNVEDTSDVFESSIGNRDLICAVLDDDGNLRTAFVYDTDDANMTPALGGTGLTMTGETPIGVNGGNYAWTGIQNNDTAALNLVLGAHQTANVKITADNDVKGAVNTTAAAGIDFAAGATISNTVYTANTTAEIGGVITVTVTVKDSDKDLTTRVITYKLTVNGDVAPVSKVTVADGSSHGFTLAKMTVNGKDASISENDVLTAGSNTITATEWATGTKDTLAIKIAATGGETAKPVLAVTTKPTSASDPTLASNGDVTFDKVGTYELVLTVTTSKANCTDTETVYNLTVTVSEKAGTAPTATVTATDATVNSMNVNYADTGAVVSLALSDDSYLSRTVTAVTVTGLTGESSLHVNDTFSGATAKPLYTVLAADGGKTGTIAVTVVTAKAGVADVEKTYTITIQCNEAKAPAPKVEIISTSDRTNVPLGEVALNGSTPCTSNVIQGTTITLKITNAQGTEVKVTVKDDISYDAASGIITTTGTSTDGTVTFTVTGAGYQTATYTFLVDVTV